MQTLISKIDHRGVLTLCMNRPEVFNAFNAVMIRELTTALDEADNNDSIRVVVITGSGTCFSAGADLNWMRSQKDASLEDNQADALELARLMRTLNYLSKPTVAMINGASFGGGLGLIAACDFTVAVEDARFGLTEVRLGIAPAVISPYVYRRIGEGNARRYFLSGERFDAQQAQHIGLVQQTETAGHLADAVEDIISALLKGGPDAVTRCKQLAFAVAGHNAEKQRATDEFTAALIARLRVSSEGQEGLTAFLEKRKPDWVISDE